MSNDIWVVEREQVMIEGEVINFSVNFVGATTVASPSSVVFKNGVDISGTVLSGSDSVSGSTVLLKTLTAQAGDGGEIYVVVVSAEVDGNTEKRKFIIRIADPSEGL